MPDGTIKEPDGHLARFARANQFWHTDSSFRAVPAKASLLSVRILPHEGGDTEFASTRAAYDQLSAEEQSQLDQKIAVHSITHSRRTLGDNAVSEEQKQALPPVQQALVRTNPVNGRKSLLIGAHVCSIDGMSDDEAQALNDRLVDSAIAAGTYRHHWKPGDMVMWDNRAVLHRGHAYDEVNEVRTLIRTTVAGAGPTVVDGRVVSGG
jgi:alpha-ketoglutarate-dependent 2,4-dichlorophenoxyacetate dioxygenase